MFFACSKLNTIIPTKLVGPLVLCFDKEIISIDVPLATLEQPLWHSVKRGMMIVHKCGCAINTVLVSDAMTRSFILEATCIDEAYECSLWVEANFDKIAEIVEKSSNFAHLKSIHTEIIGKLIYVRLSIYTHNASGHNISTKATDDVIGFVLNQYKNIKYVSISGNCCTDKKNSSINGILGRGKKVTAELIIPEKICNQFLRASPTQISNINVKKNLLGSILAGSVRSANAHYANVLLAIYLATGQDAANIVEGSQGITFAEVQSDGSLYFSVTLPNIIVGTVGNGKNLDFAMENLKLLGCLPSDDLSAKKLACIIAATVLCSELSLLATQTNFGELIASHISLERK